LLITMCPSCAAKLREGKAYDLTTVTAPRMGTCSLCYKPADETRQYQVDRKQKQKKPAPGGPPPKDRRARYKGRWRDEE